MNIMTVKFRSIVTENEKYIPVQARQAYCSTQQHYQSNYLPLPAGLAGISPVSAVDSENVSFDIRVPGEQLEANTTRILVLGE